MEVKPIGDKKCKAKQSSNSLSPSVAFSDTFPEGDGKRQNIIKTFPEGESGVYNIKRLFATLYLLRRQTIFRLS